MWLHGPGIFAPGPLVKEESRGRLDITASLYNPAYTILVN